MKKNNGKNIKKYKRTASLCLIAGLVCGGFAARNAWDVHKFDKYVIKQIEVAANVPSVGKTEGGNLSMESALTEAKNSLGISRMKNPAIIWETPATDVDVFDDLLYKAVKRTQQIQDFKDAFEKGEVDKNAPKWVKKAHSDLSIETILQKLTPEEKEKIKKVIPALDALAQSEYGQRIGSEYEALNSVIGGEQELKLKNFSRTTDLCLIHSIRPVAGDR